MPRQPRLDTPGTLHHVIVRGLDRGAIVRDDQDRAEFVTRLRDAAGATGTTIYAWALLPNHAHLLVRSGPVGLPAFMRRLLTGYAVVFNHRHRRSGHLFQNRYKSIVCEEDAYFQELVRYIHLNPLRTRQVPHLRALDDYPWAGHAGLLGRGKQPFLDRRGVLAWFGASERFARQAYHRYVAEGIPLGRRPNLVGGGLIRSLGGWSEVRAVRRRGEPQMADPRVLGSGDFVERMLRAPELQHGTAPSLAVRLTRAAARIRARCADAGITPEEIEGGGRRRQLSVLRGELAVEVVRSCGLPLADAARLLGISTSGIAKALQRLATK